MGSQKPTNDIKIGQLKYRLQHNHITMEAFMHSTAYLYTYEKNLYTYEKNDFNRQNTKL
jgi:hypothetical protein